MAAGGLLYCVNEKGLIQVVDPAKPEGEVVSELDLAQTINEWKDVQSNKEDDQVGRRQITIICYLLGSGANVINKI